VSRHRPIPGAAKAAADSVRWGGNAPPLHAGPNSVLLPAGNEEVLSGTEDSNNAAYAIRNNPPTKSDIAAITAGQGLRFTITEKIAARGTIRNVRSRMNTPCFMPLAFCDEALDLVGNAGSAPPRFNSSAVPVNR
jgi:hypothetical protein